MAYPTTPLNVVIEFFDGTNWVDITDYTYARGGNFITIRRGFPNESTSPEPGSMTLELNNRDGRFSPRNPAGPHYGLIGRNSPIRVRVDESFIAEADRIQFVGEISEWPSRWDVSGRDVWVPVTAQGILRRLGQGKSPLKSALRRRIEQGTAPSAYWALDDGQLATVGALTSGSGGPFVSVDWGTRGIVESGVADLAKWLGKGLSLASDVGVARAQVQLGSLTSITVDATFSLSAVSGEICAAFLMLTDSTITAPGSNSWTVDVEQLADGSRNILLFGYSGGSLVVFETIPIDDVDLFGPHHIRLGLTQSGGNVTWTIWLDGVSVGTDTVAFTLFSYIYVQLLYTQTAGDVVFGHVTLWTNTAATSVTDLAAAAVSGLTGETAGDRAERLAAERGLTLTLIGDPDDTQAMGPDGLGTFLDALSETWAADMALSYETRDALGLSWRSRRDLYNQEAALELDYSGAGEVAELEPIDDDQHVRNDITVRRKDGSEVRVTKDEGPLSTQDPPDGVGVYDEQVEVNVESDEQLEPIAYWRLLIGTWDEQRYPRVVINMAALAAAGKTTLMAAVAALDAGDRVRITNLPAWLPPFDADLMVLGFEPTIGHPVDWTVTLICVPYGPYSIGAYAETPIDSSTKRYDTLHSTVTSDVDAGTDTAISVTIAAGGALWTTDPASWTGLQVEAGGVVWAVTSITGSSSPQTINVTATPSNGVVKTVSAGTQIRVAPQQRAVRGL